MAEKKDLKNTDSYEHETVDASPTKRFFVSMLTRDIELSDAILDLLDNCIDGILRTNKKADKNNYSGYWAKITFDGKRFSIEDNCGGISKKLLKEKAFKFGRSENDTRDSDIPTVGSYGIGMKRAIFKMGISAKVITQTPKNAFLVQIDPDWLTDDELWELKLKKIDKPFHENGTRVEISGLHENIKDFFALPAHSTQAQSFENTLMQIVAQHFGYIILKGFKVYINDTPVKGKPLNLIFSSIKEAANGTGIAPFMYKGTKNKIKIELTVGLNSPTHGEEELEDQRSTRRSKEFAGWTIICNDRIVTYCNKDILTGWGEANVPSYHNQFRVISGIVFFTGTDAEKLPMTTTKRGIEAGSELYLYAKNFMREGTKIFTDYTNKWKSDPKGQREYSKNTNAVDARKILKEKPNRHWVKVRNNVNERKFIPSLPIPSERNPRKQIRFSRCESEIKKVSKLMFGKTDKKPSEVGEECFNYQLKKALKK
jgi:hypothetical protein